MRNENLLSFLLIKRRILKLLAIKYAYSLIVLCGISFMACSDDDPVKKNPYLQTSTRAMLKEVVEVVFNNIDSNTDITVDFGDGTVKEGKAATPITHAYTQSGDYTMLVTAGERVVQKRIRIYDLLALTEAMKQFRDADNKMVWAMTHRSHTTDKTIPENSVSAVEAAINAGADVIECDTHLTSDGVVMVCHDQTINATTNGTGDITKMTYAEIQQYNLLDRNGRVTDEKMPTLEEYLTAVRGRAYVDIDKCTGQGIFGKVADVVCRTGMMEAVFFYSGVEEGTREVLGVVEDANVYPWVGGHKLLEGLPRTFFVQTSYATEGRSPSLGDSVELGMVPSVCLLWVLDQAIPEYALDDRQLDELFDIFPTVRMIQTDVPAELIAALEKKGLR